MPILVLEKKKSKLQNKTTTGPSMDPQIPSPQLAAPPCSMMKHVTISTQKKLQTPTRHWSKNKQLRSLVTLVQKTKIWSNNTPTRHWSWTIKWWWFITVLLLGSFMLPVQTSNSGQVYPPSCLSDDKTLLGTVWDHICIIHFKSSFHIHNVINSDHLPPATVIDSVNIS